MADPAAPSTSRSSRSGSKEPRTAAVSTETENKLARAARSAQRLAELSDVPADDSTLELFPDDPTRAALQAMNIDVRQGTLSGFELPDEVLAAVEVATEGNDAQETRPETKVVRRNARAAQAADAARTAQPEAETSTVKVEQKAASTSARSCFGVDSGEPATTAAGADVSQVNVDDKGAARHTSLAEVSPVAQPMVAVAALRETAPSRFAADDTSAASRDVGASMGAGAAATARPAQPQPHSYASTARMPFGAASSAAAATQTAPRATPELDHARAAAFADTVDALYGVIADQRRAAADHSRRMKRMLSIVVGVLLVTVAIGVAQMLLLVHLTQDSILHQQRIEQMLLGQQATLATLLQTESSPAAAMPAAPAANADAPAAVAPRQPADAHSSAKAQPARKHKPSTTHAH